MPALLLPPPPLCPSNKTGDVVGEFVFTFELRVDEDEKEEEEEEAEDMEGERRL